MKLPIKFCKLTEKESLVLPARQTPDSACFDIRACFHTEKIKANGKQEVEVRDHGGGLQVSLFPNDRFLITTGLIMIPPKGYKISVKPRSGLAFNVGVSVINTPGTIDCDYSKETYILLVNHSDIPVVIKEGDRIAQIELEPVISDDVEFEEIEMDDVLAFRDLQVRKGGIGSTDK